MFCKNCGNEIKENDMFCGACGQPVENSVSKHEQVLESSPAEIKEEPVANLEVSPAESENDGFKVVVPVEPEGTDLSEFATGETDDFDDDFNDFEDEPKKKKFPKVLVASLAVIVAGAIAVTAFFNPICAFFLKTFGSDESYFSYVENKAFNSATDEITEFYGSYYENLQVDEVATDTSIKLNVSNSAIKTIETALMASGASMDLGWLENISLDTKVNMTDNELSQILAAVNVNNTEVLAIDYIMDTVNNELLVGIPSLSDKYLSSAVENGETTTEDGVAVYNSDLNMQDIYSDPEFYEALPSDDELNKIIDKYINLVLNDVDDVEKRSQEMRIEGVSQKLTVLEADIDMEDTQEIIVEVLKSVRNDKQIKKYVEDVAKYFEKKDIVEDADEVYDEFEKSIKDAIDQVRNSDIDDDRDFLTWTTYVNSSHEVVGRKIELNGNECLDYVLVRDGKEFAVEFDCGGIEITGKGTEKGDLVNGEFSVAFENKDICDLEVSNFNTDEKASKGNIRISPSSYLLKEIGLGGQSSAMLSMFSPALELDFDFSEKVGKLDVNLLNGKNSFIGITISSKQTKPTEVEMPDTEDVYSADEADEWASKLDISKVFDKLEEAGIPSELLDMVEAGMAY